MLELVQLGVDIAPHHQHLVPRILLIVVSLSAIRPLSSCRFYRARRDDGLHRRALAQQTDPYP